MPTTTETIDFNSFLTLTIKNYDKTLRGQYLQRRPAVSLMFDEYKHNDSSGGRTWQGMADYGQSSTTQFFSGTDTFNTQPQEVAQPIRFNWTYIGGSVSITETERLENSGIAALADLLDTRMKQQARTQDLIIGSQIFSDGTDFNGKSFVGLAAAVSTTPTTGIYGGLDAATWSWWRNVATTSFGSFAANGPDGSAGDAWITTWNNCCDGDIMPDYTISAQNVWEYYNRTLNKDLRFIRPESQGKTGDITWRTLEYMGKPWYWDRQCPTGRAYFLRQEDICFVVDPRFLFKWTAPLTYPDQLTYTRIVGTRFFMRGTKRLSLAVIDGITQ